MDQGNEFNKHHGWDYKKGKYRRHSGFPLKNQASIYAYFKEHSDAEEFDTFIGSKNYEYDDSETCYEFTQGYGKNPITTTICDDFYRKYNGKTIDYYIARADDGGKGNIKRHKVRVVGKYIRPNGKWALKLKLPRLN
jgi:hypothetical protein